LLTRPPWKQTEQGREKGNGDIQDLQRMVKKLPNEIIDMKRSVGEGNQGQMPYKPFFKRNPPFKSIEPPLANLNIDLGNVASDSLCTYHQENHYERDFPQWVHAMNLMANRFLNKVSLTEQSSGSVINVASQEEIDPPEYTIMLIWDLDLIIPSDDLFDSQEPPTKVLVVQTRSKGQLFSSDLSTTQTLGGRSTPDHSKAPFSPYKNPVSIHTREPPNMDYNVVEYLKRLNANISIMGICRSPQQKLLEVSIKHYDKQ
jgi:hypothetical protein